MPKFEMTHNESDNVFDNFNKMKAFKENTSFRRMIKEIKLSIPNKSSQKQNIGNEIFTMMKDFCKESESLKFTETPDYSKFTNILKSSLKRIEILSNENG
jgi:hypothetical protein